MTPRIISTLLASCWLTVVGRVLATFMYWSSGIAKLLDFSGSQAEMAHFGLEPAWLFSVATIVVQLGGSLAVILNRGAWLGAGALAVFTLLTIPIAHAFWTMDGERALLEMYVALEHVTVIGALILVAALGERTRRQAS